MNLGEALAILLSHLCSEHEDAHSPVLLTISRFLTAMPTPRLTPSYLLASLLICSAAALRVSCYRHLGRHFTFELALHPDHQLVTTGPYAYVRHPAYTGALMYVAGCMLIVLADRGSPWVQLGLWTTGVGRAVGTGIAGLAALAVGLFVKRTEVEDGVLAKQFNKEWRQWAKRTPWKLVPFVY